jgi:phosphoglycolate phosphatase-like HAD superfamily hydrolase
VPILHIKTCLGKRNLPLLIEILLSLKRAKILGNMGYMKLVLFDIDETILKMPSGADARASRVMFQNVFQLDESEKSIDNTAKTEVGIINEVIWKAQKVETGKPKPIDIPNQAYKTWANATKLELSKTQPAVLPGIKEMLEHLYKNPDIRIGLLTGNSYWRSEIKLQSVDLDNYFRDEHGRLFGVFGNQRHKRSELLDFAIQNLLEANEKLIIIDDSLLGAQMCKDKNILSILVATGNASLEKLRSFSPHAFSDFDNQRWLKATEIIDQS